jgi:hypothetical protein
MLALFAVLVWTLLLWFLVGLCHAARVGDDQGLATRELRPSAGDRQGSEATAVSDPEPAADRAALAA